MSTIRKKEIDQALAVGWEGLLKTEHIQKLTDDFLYAVMCQLLGGHEVHLPGFGTFKVSVRKGARQQKVVLTKGTFKKGEKGGTHTVTVDKKYYVSFRRAAAFRQMFQERFGKNKARSAVT